MRKQDIKDIKLGLRQLTFGFEKNVLKEQDLIMSCIKNLPELKKDSDIAAGFDRLKKILSSPRPYDLIMEAGEWLEKVKAYNDKIEENKTKQCRIAALSKVDNMIERMKVHLDAHKTGQDLRNKSLYYLRIINKSISKAKNIKRIDFYINEAEDKFDTFWEEIAKNFDS